MAGWEFTYRGGNCGGAISKVLWAIAEEVKLKERVANDIVFMKAEFEMSQSFICVADEECVKNTEVRTGKLKLAVIFEKRGVCRDKNPP